MKPDICKASLAGKIGNLYLLVSMDKTMSATLKQSLLGVLKDAYWEMMAQCVFEDSLSEGSVPNMESNEGIGSLLDPDIK